MYAAPLQGKIFAYTPGCNGAAYITVSRLPSLISPNRSVKTFSSQSPGTPRP